MAYIGFTLHFMFFVPGGCFLGGEGFLYSVCHVAGQHGLPLTIAVPKEWN